MPQVYQAIRTGRPSGRVARRRERCGRAFATFGRRTANSHRGSRIPRAGANAVARFARARLTIRSVCRVRIGA
jgi:hypothetical protein